MSNNGTRIDTDLHEKIEQYLEEHELSMSEFMRTSVEHVFAQTQTNGDPGIHALTEQLQKRCSAST